MRDATFFESQPVKLGTMDLVERGAQLSALLVRIANDEAHAKAVATGAKAALESLRGEAAELARIVHTKQENRPVECQDSYDRQSLTVETSRLDTGEVVYSRPMTAEERKQTMQEELDFARKAGAQEAADSVIDAARPAGLAPGAEVPAKRGRKSGAATE